jgi:hypothetical protein
MGNQNLYIEEEQATQWQKKKYKRTNNDQQNIYKTKDRVTWTPLKTGGELRCSGRVDSSCFTSDACLRQVEHIHGYLHICDTDIP